MQKWLNYLETHVASYDKSSHLNILVLQAPANFRELVNAPVFATGENVLNGIVCYAPNDATYLHTLFGHDNYAYFLVDGMIHELGHLYASAGDGEAKSLLYAAAECPPFDRLLIGEGLIGYIHRLFMAEHYVGGRVVWQNQITAALQSAQTRPRRNPLLEWLILDLHLRQIHHSDVVMLLRALIAYQTAQDSGFSDVGVLATVLAQDFNITLTNPYHAMLTSTDPIDYVAILTQLDDYRTLKLP